MSKVRKNEAFYGNEIERVAWFISILYSSKYVFNSISLDYTLTDDLNKSYIKSYTYFLEVLYDFFKNRDSKAGLVHEVYNSELDLSNFDCPFFPHQLFRRMSAKDVVRPKPQKHLKV